MTENGQWFKSSYSGNQGECVEVRLNVDSADVRDSKDPEGGQFRLPAEGWKALLEAVSKGSAGRS